MNNSLPLRPVELQEATGIESKPAFREAFQRRRWLVPVAGPFDVRTGVRATLRWRKMDSNFWYRGTKAVDFRSIPGIAGVSVGLLNDTT